MGFLDRQAWLDEYHLILRFKLVELVSLGPTE
jgi:hypothetical protein